MNANDILKKAMEMDQFDNNLPQVEIEEICTLGKVWDGNGDAPIGDGVGDWDSCCYLIHETDGGVKTHINYVYDVLEVKEDELENVIKITKIELI